MCCESRALTTTPQTANWHSVGWLATLSQKMWKKSDWIAPHFTDPSFHILPIPYSSFYRQLIPNFTDSSFHILSIHHSSFYRPRRDETLSEPPKFELMDATVDCESTALCTAQKRLIGKLTLIDPVRRPKRFAGILGYWHWTGIKKTKEIFTGKLTLPGMTTGKLGQHMKTVHNTVLMIHSSCYVKQANRWIIM